MQPHATGVYVNNLGAEGADRVRAATAPATYDRLVALKTRYDPNNVFRLNQEHRPPPRLIRVPDRRGRNRPVALSYRS